MINLYLNGLCLKHLQELSSTCTQYFLWCKSQSLHFRQRKFKERLNEVDLHINRHGSDLRLKLPGCFSLKMLLYEKLFCCWNWYFVERHC